MIGDDVEDDVVGAMKTGYKGILVKTGKYTEGDEIKVAPNFPTVIAENFSQAVDIIVSSILIEKGFDLKEKKESDEPTPAELKQLNIEREKARKIAAYTDLDCGNCYAPPPPTTNPENVKNCDEKDNDKS